MAGPSQTPSRTITRGFSYSCLKFYSFQRYDLLDNPMSLYFCNILELYDYQMFF